MKGGYYFIIIKCENLYYCFSIPVILVTLQWSIAIWKCWFEDLISRISICLLGPPLWAGGQPSPHAEFLSGASFSMKGS